MNLQAQLCWRWGGCFFFNKWKTVNYSHKTVSVFARHYHTFKKRSSVKVMQSALSKCVACVQNQHEAPSFHLNFYVYGSNQHHHIFLSVSSLKVSFMSDITQDIHQQRVFVFCFSKVLEIFRYFVYICEACIW